MPQPSTAAFNVNDQRFQAELALLAASYPALHSQLLAQLLALMGKPWARVAEVAAYKLREDQFNGSITVGTMSFCNGQVELLVLMDYDVITPVTFLVPSFYSILGDRP